MNIETLNYEFSVCKVQDESNLDLSKEFYFISKTDEELSLVCQTLDVPKNTIARDDGWKAFRIPGVLDFSLIGILAKIAKTLAENGISIFAVSTYNTDYVLVKKESFDKALKVLQGIDVYFGLNSPLARNFRSGVTDF